jgi:hypothetical protein
MRNASLPGWIRGVLATLLGVCALAACAGGGSAKPVAGTVAPAAVTGDATAQAALERACYGCHASGYGLGGRERLAYSYWFRSSARKAVDFSHWSELSAEKQSKQLHAIEQTVKDGHMPPWDAALFEGSAKLTPAEREALLRMAEQAAS